MSRPPTGIMVAVQPGASGLKFFVDECLKSAAIVDALRAALGPGDTLEVSPRGGSLRSGWPVGYGAVCFSKDRRALRKILRYELALVLLGEASAAEQAQWIVAGLPRIRRAATILNRAFVVRCGYFGILTVVYEGGVALKRPYTLHA